jgi:hypothetical protein
MATLTREELKKKFKNGLIPSEKDFCDLIESMLNKSDDNFFGQWKPGVKYYLGDVVIHGKTLYQLIQTETALDGDSGKPAKPVAKPVARNTPSTPPAEDKGVPYCSANPPDCDTTHWGKLVFELKDGDWEYDNDELYARNLNWKVGIGTSRPKARLHVAEESRGRMMFNPVDPLPNAHETVQTSPELRMERDLAEDCDLCYLSVRLREDVAHIETSADKGFFLEQTKTGGTPATVLAAVTPVGTGIGTADPKAALDVYTKGVGEWEINPRGGRKATARLTDLASGHCAVQTVDDMFNIFTTNARQGFRFQPESAMVTGKSGAQPPIVVIDEKGRLGIGTDSPKCSLEVVNPACGMAVVSIENTNPAFSVINLKPAGKTSYLTTGANNSFAVFKTDADCGFVFKRGAEYDPTGSKSPEKDLDGVPQVYIDQDGKVGIGTPPDQYELDLKGTSRSYEAYLNTNETTIKETGIIENALDVICRLTPILYEWTNPGAVLSKRQQFGLKASECSEYVPEVVKTLDNSDDIAIAYQNLVPLLIRAIQEQQKMIDNLIAAKK